MSAHGDTVHKRTEVPGKFEEGPQSKPTEVAAIKTSAETAGTEGSPDSFVEHHDTTDFAERPLSHEKPEPNPAVQELHSTESNSTRASSVTASKQSVPNLECEPEPRGWSDSPITESALRELIDTGVFDFARGGSTRASPRSSASPILLMQEQVAKFVDRNRDGPKRLSIASQKSAYAPDTWNRRIGPHHTPAIRHLHEQHSFESGHRNILDPMLQRNASHQALRSEQIPFGQEGPSNLRPVQDRPESYFDTNVEPRFSYLENPAVYDSLPISPAPLEAAGTPEGSLDNCLSVDPGTCWPPNDPVETDSSYHVNVEQGWMDDLLCDDAGIKSNAFVVANYGAWENDCADEREWENVVASSTPRHDLTEAQRRSSAEVSAHPTKVHEPWTRGSVHHHLNHQLDEIGSPRVWDSPTASWFWRPNLFF